ncbi:MAG TPA: hypothetical protein VEJ63_03380 [Planctomycetota bacterium]|nr:hypothetical protein [Planctomycetota bacterium]
MIFIPGPELKTPRNIALALGVLLSIAAVIGAVFDWQHFLQSYLVGFFFVLSLSVGCLGLLMLNHVAGGMWGAPIRRILESASLQSFLLVLLVIPLLIGMQQLWAWTRPDAALLIHHLEEKQWYLNVPGFIARVIVCLALFCTLAWLLSRWSLKQDTDRSHARQQRMASLSAPGMVASVIAVSLLSVDFIMSLQPEWWSTMFAFQAATSFLLVAIAFSIVVLVWVSRRLPQLFESSPPERLHDLGNLLLALVLFWTYVSFSQFLIIYSGNLPDEVTFYLRRIRNGWEYIGIALAAFHFIVPFAVLLSREAKRRPGTLWAIAAVLLLFHFVDLFWLVMPAFRPVLYFHWLDAVVPLALICLWFGGFLWSYSSHPVLARVLLPRPPAPEAEMGLSPKGESA